MVVRDAVFLVGISLAFEQAVHFLPPDAIAVADLVEVLELFVPKKKVDAGDEHRYVG